MSRLQLGSFTPATVVRATIFRKKYVSVDENYGPGHQGTTTSYPCYLDFILRGEDVRSPFLFLGGWDVMTG